MSKVIGIMIGDKVEWHAKNQPYGADHDTLCGVDAADETLDHNGIVEPPKGQKIDCEMCRLIFKGFKGLKLRESDFKTK